MGVAQRGRGTPQSISIKECKREKGRQEKPESVEARGREKNGVAREKDYRRNFLYRRRRFRPG